MQQCCEDLPTQPDPDCNHIYLIGGDMGILYSKYKKNVTLIYPNMYLTNRRGTCIIAIKYRTEFQEKEITTEIRFDSSESCAALEKKDIQECKSPDLDPFAGCTPVDCLLKYSGEKSYFNPVTKQCQCVATCVNRDNDCDTPDTAYSPYSNRCIDLKRPVTAEDLIAIEENQVENTCSPNLGNVVCHHGTVDNSGTCECSNGWVTSPEEESIYEPMSGLYHMCNVEIGPWGCVNKHKLKTTILLIAIFGLTIISKLLLAMCLLNWCIKHFKKSREKTCTDRLDPEDETLILCEDLSGYYEEKCVCSDSQKKEDTQEESPADNLKMETVNVAYFPCCPSTFSSIRASTGSEKSKYSTKSDNSINLSKTTTGSYTISFQSEGLSEQSEVNEEDENYEIEFSEEEEFGEDSKANCECLEEVEQDFSFVSEDDELVAEEQSKSSKKPEKNSSSSSKDSKKTEVKSKSMKGE